jgi:glucose-1-phosphate thymidylyltransferase
MRVRFKAIIVVDAATSSEGRRGGSRLTALEHVANRPIVHHVLDSLTEAGAQEVVVAVDAEAMTDVSASLRDYPGDRTSVAFALCDSTADVASVLAAAAPLVADTACLMQPANGLLDAPVSRLLDQLAEHGKDLVVWAPIESSGDSDGNRTGRFGGRPGSGRDDHPGEISVFGPGVINHAAKVARNLAAPDLASAADRLAAAGASVEVRPLSDWHRYLGHGADLLALNRVTLGRISGDPRSNSSTGNRIEGHALIHPTATVRDSVIVGPAVIGAGASISDAYIGPYTSVGAGARIEGTEIERSIVAPGASVMYVSGRLVSSLVGGGAKVFTDFSLPRALRLWVGEGDEIALC